MFLVTMYACDPHTYHQASPLLMSQHGSLPSSCCHSHSLHNAAFQVQAPSILMRQYNLAISLRVYIMYTKVSMASSLVYAGSSEPMTSLYSSLVHSAPPCCTCDRFDRYEHLRFLGFNCGSVKIEVFSLGLPALPPLVSDHCSVNHPRHGSLSL